MGILAPDKLPDTREQLLAKLQLWSEHLSEYKQGKSNRVLTLAQIHRELDGLLDALIELRGR